MCSHAPPSLQVIGLTLRDYQDNVRATDRDWFYLNTDGTAQNPAVGDGYYNDLEYELGRPWQIPAVVYVRGTDLVVDLTFTNPGFTTQSGTLTVNEVQIAVPDGEFWTFVPLTADGPHSVSVPPFGGTDTVTLTFELPDYVALGELQVDIDIDSTGGPLWSTGGWVTWERIYLTDSMPVAKQTIPWTDLLDYTCTWALGETGQTDVAEEVTKGMFWNSPFDYNMGVNSAVYWSDNQSFSFYNLSSALAVVHAGMDCQDVSGFLSLAFESQGLSTGCKVLTNADNPPTGRFYTNLVCPMGSDATSLTNYTQTFFGYHQVTETNSSVYDAAIAQRIDLAGQAFNNPPFGWSEGGYWQTAYQLAFAGLVRGPENPFVTQAVQKRKQSLDYRRHKLGA